MLGRLLEFKRRRFPKGVKRELIKTRNRLFRRTTRASLARSLRGLELPGRSVVCVHSMLSALGYLADGPEGVLDSVRDAVPDATLMVPTFAIGSSCREWLADEPILDPAQTRSTSGLLTETLWRRPGARRSLHPTHPCAALGPLADELIDGTERAETPFGDDSTYGRFADRDDAWLLEIHTNNTSLVHRFQEVANTPNLFLDELFDARSRAADGTVTSYRVQVHFPKLPLYVAMPPGPDGAHDYVWLPDYSLQMPDYNRGRTLDRLQPHNREFLLAREKQLLDDDVLRVARHRDALLIALRARPYTERLSAELAESYRRFPEAYDLDLLRRLDEAGKLDK